MTARAASELLSSSSTATRNSSLSFAGPLCVGLAIKNSIVGRPLWAFSYCAKKMRAETMPAHTNSPAGTARPIQIKKPAKSSPAGFSIGERGGSVSSTSTSRTFIGASPPPRTGNEEGNKRRGLALFMRRARRTLRGTTLRLSRRHRWRARYRLPAWEMACFCPSTIGKPRLECSRHDQRIPAVSAPLA